jgi:hypothetical protein
VRAGLATTGKDTYVRKRYQPGQWADRLNLLNQSTGQAPTSPAFAASVEVLKKAITQAQSSESQIVAGGNPDTGGQLNVFA